MQLINAETMLLEDFTVRKVPQYAILSHTWTEEEVTFQEFTCQNNDTAKKGGFAKIAQTCKLARANHIGYVWIDTCCIDKTSSAELVKAINSMFQWYKNASVCYAYLSDLPQRGEVTEDWSVDHGIVEDSPVRYDELRVCKWFTRGWTLQELIAPKTVHFYDETWTFRGTKDGFAELIYQITHIHPLVLRDSEQLAQLSIAERMTWASRRKTTWIEDAAYCLLGIFDINMPLLYGEGNKAFTRLQQEIIRNNSDLSIFGWSTEESVISVDYHAGFSDGCQVNCGHQDDNEDGFYSVLAPSPNEFVAPRYWSILNSAEHSVTNRGIKIYCSLLEICLEGCDFYECRCCSDRRKYVLVIGRTIIESSWGIILEKLGPDVFIRSSKRLIRLNGQTKFFASSTRHRAIYLLTQAPYSTQYPTSLPLRIREGTRFVIQSATPDYRWNSCKRHWYIESDSPQEWGMVSLKFSSLGDRGGVCVLFLGGSGRVSVLDSLIYRKEIGLVSQSSSELGWHDVFDFFDGDNLPRNSNKMMVEGQELKVMARMGNPWAEDWALEVWTEKSEGNGSPSRVCPVLTDSSSARATVSLSIAPIDYSKRDNIDTGSKPETLPQQPPAPKANPPPAPAASQSAASASAATHSPLGSIQAVIVWCNVEKRNFLPWSATTIPAGHPVFSQPVAPIPALIEVPLVLHRVGTRSANRSDLDNQIATYLNIDADSGFAPPAWQSLVGTIVVARKDGKPLLPQHLAGVWMYCGYILDLFGDGEGAPRRLYNRQAFEKWWKDYCEEQKQKQFRSGKGGEEDLDDWQAVRSPYEI